MTAKAKDKCKARMANSLVLCALPAGHEGQHVNRSKKYFWVNGSALGEPVWAVIADHYVELDLTYDEARDRVKELKEKRQPGTVIVTNEAAKRMTSGAAGVTAPSLPDMKHG